MPSLANRLMAAKLRLIADELDPMVEPDLGPVVVKVKVYRDGQMWREQLVPLPNVGDGVFPWGRHEGAIVYEDGVPHHSTDWHMTIQRVGAHDNELADFHRQAGA